MASIYFDRNLNVRERKEQKMAGKTINYSGFFWEIGICIRNGNTCWFNGILPCVIMSDIYIVHSKLKNKLLPVERVIAEGGYIGNPRILDSDEYMRDKSKRILKSIRTFHACHKTTNGCSRKNWRYSD